MTTLIALATYWELLGGILALAAWPLFAGVALVAGGIGGYYVWRARRHR